MLLNDGLHSISLFINGVGATDTLLQVRDVLAFAVKDTGVMRQEFMGPWLGAVRPRLHWQTAQLSVAAEADPAHNQPAPGPRAPFKPVDGVDATGHEQVRLLPRDG
jgi:hypothetical protein